MQQTKKIFSLAKLVKIIHSQYSRAEIVLATGCFDLLHPAHKAFLKAAKKQGNLLIVGLETDKRVSLLKGENRPVNCWQNRAKNLVKLKEVDFIFPLPEKFNQRKEHLKLLKMINPKILALSKNTPFLNNKKELIKKIKGRIFIFPYNPKYSTTKLLTK